MSTLNSILRPLFDTLLAPLSGLNPLVGLTILSLVFAIVILIVVKYTSNQAKIEAVKRRIHGSLFEIRLFNDDFRAIFRAVGDILRHNAHYMWLWLIPLLCMTAPTVLFIGQLQFQYGYSAFEPGDTLLLKVEMKESGAKPAVELEVPAGLVAETPSVWSPLTRELTWRLAVKEAGEHELGVVLNGEKVTKQVDASDGVKRRSPRRPSTGFWDQVMFPAEASVPATAAVRSIEVTYPPGDGGMSGWDHELTWMGILFVLSIVFALVLSKPMGVTI